MTAVSVGYRWRLRQVMAEHGLWKTSELGPLLAARGVSLSAAQVYRLVAQAPERLSLQTLTALCDIFSVSPNDLIELTGKAEQPTKATALPAKARPKRARVTPS
jgi:DNA-binding Xre family transcriptional regulator